MSHDGWKRTTVVQQNKSVLRNTSTQKGTVLTSCGIFPYHSKPNNVMNIPEKMKKTNKNNEYVRRRQRNQRNKEKGNEKKEKRKTRRTKRCSKYACGVQAESRRDKFPVCRSTTSPYVPLLDQPKADTQRPDRRKEERPWDEQPYTYVQPLGRGRSHKKTKKTKQKKIRNKTTRDN